MSNVAEAIIPWTTGPISVISSTTIIIMILRSKKALSIPYHRILFGLSIADIVASAAISAGSLPAPKDTLHLRYAFGYQSTCDAQGFVFLAGAVAEPLYLSSLQLYYLCAIKYGMKAEDIQRKVEKFLHGIPILYGMTAAITLLVTGSIHATSSWCCIESYPYGCRYDEDLKCTRGKHLLLMRAIFEGFPLLVSSLCMSIVMSMLYRAQRKQEIAIDGYKFKAYTPSLTSMTNISQRRSQQKTRKSRKMLDRIIQYSAAYWLAYFFPLLANTIDTFGVRINALFILQSIFYPLQGFYTLLVFINPHYKKVRESSEELSVLQAIAVTIQSYGGANYTQRLGIQDDEDNIYEENESVSFEHIDSLVKQTLRRTSVL